MIRTTEIGTSGFKITDHRQNGVTLRSYTEYKILKLTERQEIVRSYLRLHSVKTREIHGKLYAYDEHWDTVKQVRGGEWVNATAWTLRDTRDFLGY